MPEYNATSNLTLNKSLGSWSAGTQVQFIEYTDICKGVPNSALVRITGVQCTVPLSYITERRKRDTTVPYPTKQERVDNGD